MDSAKTFSENSVEPKIVKREKRMVDAMVLIYCKNHHGYAVASCVKCIELGVMLRVDWRIVDIERKSLFVVNVA